MPMTPPQKAQRSGVNVKWQEAGREAWRNFATGTSHGLALASALFVLTAVLGGFDALSVRAMVDDAVDFQSHGGATWILQAPRMIDGTACDALAGAGNVQASGALRQEEDGLVTSTLPRNPIPAFSVTSGFEQVVSVRTPDPGVGVWISSDVASRYGAGASGMLATSDGQVRVDGVFEYPDDGRDTRLGFAVLAPTQVSDGYFDECWLTVWPMDDSSLALARTALAPTPDQSSLSQIRYQQLNLTLATTYDGLSTFLERPSRFAPVLAFFCGIALGVIALWPRRLEHASALHSGLPKDFLLLETLLETALWALCGVIVAAPWILLIASRASTDGLIVGFAGLRPLLAGFCGVMIGVSVGVWTSRERNLFKLFKNR